MRRVSKSIMRAASWSGDRATADARPARVARRAMMVMVLLQPPVVAIHSIQTGPRGRPTQRVEVNGPIRERRKGGLA